jgi:signal transduction histidine kinase
VRNTIRVRLTVLFAALFLVLAAVLVGTSYAFVARATTPQAQAEERASALQKALADQGIQVNFGPPRVGQDNGGPGSVARDPISQAVHDIESQARANVLQDLLKRSLIAFAISAVIAVGLAYWLAGRVLRPIDEIARAANSLSESTLDRRLPNDGPADEFGRLKTAFNGMLARLESAFESRQRFASDASHELRTPLAVMQASADNVLTSARPPKQARELAEEVQRQVSRSDSLMESLLTLSRADDVTNTRERVDLADIAARVVTEKERRATAAGIRLELDVEDALVSADPILMERMIANLIENAVRYNVASDGWVTCTVRTIDGAAQIQVANSGPEVEAADVEALFERFRRGAQRSEVSGHGLGLPIVSRVADVHGGKVVALPGVEGGLIVTVTIPGVA